MKVSELTGYWLNYWTAKAEGKALSSECDASRTDAVLVGTGAGDLEPFDPAADWDTGGPIVEREEIATYRYDEWVALVKPDVSPSGGLMAHIVESGPTLLIAAMRAYVASKFGDKVPEE